MAAADKKRKVDQEQKEEMAIARAAYASGSEKVQKGIISRRSGKAVSKMIWNFAPIVCCYLDYFWSFDNRQVA